MGAPAVMEAILPFVRRGDVPGAIVGLWRRGVLSLEAVGLAAPGEGTPITVDSLMRISSNTKPLAAAAALSLAQDGRLALDDPVERFVSELAGRRVLRRLDSALDDTEPAARLITVEDLLTMRLGFGFVLECESRAIAAAAAAGLGIGPPDPSIELGGPSRGATTGHETARSIRARSAPSGSTMTVCETPWRGPLAPGRSRQRPIAAHRAGRCASLPSRGQPNDRYSWPYGWRWSSITIACDRPPPSGSLPSRRRVRGRDGRAFCSAGSLLRTSQGLTQS